MTSLTVSECSKTVYHRSDFQNLFLLNEKLKGLSNSSVKYLSIPFRFQYTGAFNLP